jgi:hypothetical protein
LRLESGGCQAQPGAPSGPTRDDHLARHGTPSRGRR